MTKADKIVKALLDDLTDRRGLGHEWYQIDKDIQQEIKNTWAEIIQEELDKD